MASYSPIPDQPEEVDVFAWDGSIWGGPTDGTLSDNERTCARCRGLGVVEVRGQESDCIDCDGYGSVLI